MRSAAVLFILAAALLAALPASAARKKVRVAPPEHIACTRYGCHPVPRGCHPQIGFDPWGNPTGYDIIVCPPRR